MRLDKLQIGSPKNSPTHQFNLKNVSIDFDENHFVTVVIGWNGTGKSNVLEAISIIFRDLVMKKRAPSFAFTLKYRMGSGSDVLHIEIDADPDRAKDSYEIYVASKTSARDTVGYQNNLIELDPSSDRQGEKLSLSSFLKDQKKYLPQYVFSYYSGESERMYEVFRPYLEKFDSELRAGRNPGLKRLFYALPVHSQFVLLSS